MVIHRPDESFGGFVPGFAAHGVSAGGCILVALEFVVAGVTGVAHLHLVAVRPAVSVGIQWWVLASRIRSDDGKAGWCVAVSGGKDGVRSDEILQMFAECSIDFDKLIVGVGEQRYNVNFKGYC